MAESSIRAVYLELGLAAFLQLETSGKDVWERGEVCFRRGVLSRRFARSHR
jgi:hypothetical protein